MGTVESGVVKSLIHLSFFGALATQQLLGFRAPERKELVSELQLRYQNATGKNAANQNAANGIVLTVQQAGIAATAVSAGTLAPENKVVEGRLVQLGAFSQLRVQQGGGRLLAPGEPVWITKIEAKGDQIRLMLLTCDGAFSGQLTFQFTKDYLANATPADMEKVIDGFLSSAAPAPSNPGQTVSVQQRAPQPQGAGPASISLGDRIDQVTAAFGPPLQIVDLGSRKTFHYEKLKVMFVDGKVADVQ